MADATYPALTRFVRRQGKANIRQARKEALNSRETSSEVRSQATPDTRRGIKPMGGHQKDSQRHLRGRENRSKGSGAQASGPSGSARPDLKSCTGWKDEAGVLHLYRKPNSSARVTLVSPDGERFLVSSRLAKTRAEFEHRAGNHFKYSQTGLKRSGNAPLAIGTTLTSAVAEEFHFTKTGNRGVRLFGRSFIGAPRTSVSSPGGSSAGCVLTNGIMPISPLALGGRALLEAGTFEQCKAHKLRVIYIPTQPATIAGSVFLTYTADSGVRMDHTGNSYLAHLAQNGQFIEGPVWQPLSLDIDPQNANVRYWDNSSGDFKLEVQGLVSFGAASTIANESGALLDHDVGNLFIEYDYEFFAPTLDYEVPLITSINADINMGTTNVTAVADAAIEVFASSQTVLPWMLLTGAPANVEEYYGIFTVRNTLTVGFWFNAAGSYRLPTDNTAHTMVQAGKTFFLRFFTTATDTLILFFSNLTDASNALAQYGGYDPLTLSDGQLMWHQSGTTADDTTQVRGSLRFIPMSTDNL